MFFTRLPLWRLASVERSYFERVVPLWPLAGWLTGGSMALVLWCADQTDVATGIAAALAIAVRCILTGALHEDGFADFCDAFGGGFDRERTLAIMKDSHIGTYGVLGLVFYMLLFWNMLSDLIDSGLSPLTVIAADALAKGLSSTIIYVLPYARTAAAAKNRLVYARPPLPERMLTLVLALTPLLIACLAAPDDVPSPAQWCMALVLPVAVCAMLFRWMHSRIQGYTGDCCGATFILSELSIYLSLCIMPC